jgi:hypothetical protein
MARHIRSVLVLEAWTRVTVQDKSSEMRLIAAFPTDAHYFPDGNESAPWLDIIVTEPYRIQYHFPLI